MSKEIRLDRRSIVEFTREKCDLRRSKLGNVIADEIYCTLTSYRAGSDDERETVDEDLVMLMLEFGRALYVRGLQDSYGSMCNAVSDLRKGC